MSRLFSFNFFKIPLTNAETNYILESKTPISFFLKKLQIHSPLNNIKYCSLPTFIKWSYFDFLFDILHLNFVQNNFIFFELKLFWTKLIGLNFKSDFLTTTIILDEKLNSIKCQNDIYLTSRNINYTFFSYLEYFDSSTAIVLNNTNILNISIPADLTIKELEKLDNQLLTNSDKFLWGHVKQPASYFSYAPELYEFRDFAPFKKNTKFETQIYWFNSLEDYYSLAYHWVTNDLMTFYYEPYYFFWDKLEQSMETFWLVSFFWQRTLLLEDWIYSDPSVKKDKPIFQPLAQFFHKSELKSGLKILWWINNYQDYTIYPYYLWFDDFQDFSIDKNFLHIWNYWLGASHNSNIFSSTNFIGDLNILWEKIYTPKAHAPSSHTRIDLSYKDYNYRLINFSFFADIGMMWGHLNPAFDKMILGYNWFFHSGDNFMDSHLSLKYVRYQLTYNLWGPFEYLAVDYSWFQPTYFSDQMSSIRVPMILLISKNYLNTKQMNIFIKDYDTAFNFKRFKKFQKITAENFFNMSKLSWLEWLRDPMTISSKVQPFEWVVNLFYGYNSSECISNYPSWYSELMNSLQFYASLTYNYTEDKFQEEWFKQIVKSFSSENNDFLGNVSIYFNKISPQFPLKTFFYYINNKVFDDIGYLYTARNWGDIFWIPTNLNWLKDLSIIHFEVIPIPHYSWKLVILNNFVFDWSLLQLPEYFKILLNLNYSYNTFLSINLWRTGLGLTVIDDKKLDFMVVPTLPYSFPNSFGVDLNLIYFNWLISSITNIYFNYFTYYYNKIVLNLELKTSNILKTLENSLFYTYIKTFLFENFYLYVWFPLEYRFLILKFFDFYKNFFFINLCSLYVSNVLALTFPSNFLFKFIYFSYFFNLYLIDKIINSINLNKKNVKIDFLNSISELSDLSLPIFEKLKIKFENFIFFCYYPVNFLYIWWLNPLFLELNSFLPDFFKKIDYYLVTFLSENKIKYFLNYFLGFVIIPHKDVLVKVYSLKGTPYLIASISLYDLKFDFPNFYFFLPTLYTCDPIRIISFYNNKTTSLPFYLRNFFLNIKSDEDYYRFVLLLTVYELNRLSTVDTNLEKLVPIINTIDSKKLKLSTLEYQRYINYVIKHKTYKKS